MRRNLLVPALAALATLGCAELAAIAPSVTVDVVARQRTDVGGEAWSWAIGGRLAARLDAAAGSRDRDALADADATRAGPAEAPGGPGPTAPARCRIAPICVWEARARARALERARAVWVEEEP